jgi:hypothetical protein
LNKISWGALGAVDSKMLAIKQTPLYQESVIQGCSAGKMEVVIVMVQSGKCGTNLQGCNWAVSTQPIPGHADYQQAMGISRWYHSNLTSGRICRTGQQKPTKWFEVWVQDDWHDVVSRLQRLKRVTQATALTELKIREDIDRRMKEVVDLSGGDGTRADPIQVAEQA